MIAYLLFYTALAITFYTDIRYFLIYRYVTILLIPFFLLGSWLSSTPILLAESILGALCGYLILWAVNRLYHYYRGFDGIGQGDFELLAMIGSFLGPLGVLHTLTIGSCLGSAYAVMMIILKKASGNTQIPFGAFLALGGFIYTLMC